MHGLMSVRGKAAEQCISKIPFSLMAVVQNALSHAWRKLLTEVASGQFSVCNAHEDTITERLYMILGSLHASEKDEVKGFSMFETPIREGNLRNYKGDRLDCQPDLTFRPLKGKISTNNSAITGIFVECKPIDSQHPIGSTYCKEGISRFIKGDYAWAVDRAIMLAYVRNVCQLPKGLSYVLENEAEKKNCRLIKGLSTLGVTSEGVDVYCTVHDRIFSTSSSHKSKPVSLHHLWLSPDAPCETSKCRT